MTAQEEPRRVVVTGIGLVTGLGGGREESWTGLRRGASGFGRLELEDPRGGPPHHGSPAPFPGRFEAGFDPTGPLLDAAADEALADSGIASGGWRPDRVGVLVGLSKGRVGPLEREASRGSAAGAGAWFDLWPGGGAAQVARRLGARGPCLAPIAACATGLVAALQGAQLIRRGECDVALAGAVDASLTPFMLGAFRRMKALARVAEGGDASRTVRPWDRNRSGFLVGEGGAVLVLESVEHARSRGARAYVELAGGALGGDAHHITDLSPDPGALAHVIATALAEARLEPAQVDHVNVHGTATRSNDPLECRALRRALGAAADRVICTANKPQIGHLLGAAGAVELAMSCLSVRDGFVPPLRNLEERDPECDLDAAPPSGQHREIRAALKLSLGFGGHLAVAVLRQAPAELRRPALPS